MLSWNTVLIFCLVWYVLLCKIQGCKSFLNSHESVFSKLISFFVLPTFPCLFSCIVELTPSKWGLVTDRLLVLSRMFSNIITRVQEFLWRLLELHILKMVAFFSVWVALEEVNKSVCLSLSGHMDQHINDTCLWHWFIYRCMPCLYYDLHFILSVAICDEPGIGGFVVSGNALSSLQVHGFLSVYNMGVCHHRM